MVALVGRRLIAIVPVLFFVTLAVNSLILFVPGDPAVRIAGEGASPEHIAQVRHALGLDRPWWPRYLDWITGTVRGDLGHSIMNGDSVTRMLLERMPVTLALLLAAMVFAVLVGAPAGMLSALRRGRWPDKVVRGLATIGIGFPAYWLGLLLLMVFAIRLHAFPAIDYVPLFADPVGWLHHIVLPAVALGAPAAAEVARQLRTSMIDTLGRDFVRTATAKGLRRRVVLGKHVLKQSAVPVVTVLATQVSLMLGAAVIVEQTFVLPGIGTLAVTSVINNDVIVVQGIVVVSTVVIVLANLVADVLNAWLDPKAH